MIMGAESIQRVVSKASRPRPRIIKSNVDLIELFLQAVRREFIASLPPRARKAQRTLGRRLVNGLSDLLRGGSLLIDGKAVTPRISLINGQGTLAVPRAWVDADGTVPIDRTGPDAHQASWAFQIAAAQAVNPASTRPAALWTDICHAAANAVAGALDFAEVRLATTKDAWGFLLCATRDGRRMIFPEIDIAHHEAADGPSIFHMGRLLLAPPPASERNIVRDIERFHVRSKRRPWYNSDPRVFAKGEAVATTSSAAHRRLLRGVTATSAKFDVPEIGQMLGLPQPQIDGLRRRWTAFIARAFTRTYFEKDGHRYRPMIVFSGKDRSVLLPQRTPGDGGTPRLVPDDPTDEMIRAAQAHLVEHSIKALMKCGIGRGQAVRASAWLLYEMLSRVDNGTHGARTTGEFLALFGLQADDGAVLIPREDRQVSLMLFAAIRTMPSAKIAKP